MLVSHNNVRVLQFYVIIFRLWPKSFIIFFFFTLLLFIADCALYFCPFTLCMLSCWSSGMNKGVLNWIEMKPLNHHGKTWNYHVISSSSSCLTSKLSRINVKRSRYSMIVYFGWQHIQLKCSLTVQLTFLIDQPI